MILAYLDKLRDVLNTNEGFLEEMRYIHSLSVLIKYISLLITRQRVDERVLVVGGAGRKIHDQVLETKSPCIKVLIINGIDRVEPLGKAMRVMHWASLVAVLQLF